MTKKLVKDDKEFRLTLKFRKWLDLYIKTGNATEAAMKSYDCKDRHSAGQIGHENLMKLDYTELLESAGVTDFELINTLKGGLAAMKQLSAKILVLGGNKDANNQTDDFIEVPDFAVRHKYLETALKLKRRLTSDNQTNVQVNNFNWEKR